MSKKFVTIEDVYNKTGGYPSESYESGYFKSQQDAQVHAGPSNFPRKKKILETGTVDADALAKYGENDFVLDDDILLKDISYFVISEFETRANPNTKRIYGKVTCSEHPHYQIGNAINGGIVITYIGNGLRSTSGYALYYRGDGVFTFEIGQYELVNGQSYGLELEHIGATGMTFTGKKSTNGICYPTMNPYA